MEGFIIENIANLYQIQAQEGIYEAVARGKFKQEEITPVVGDFVCFEITDKVEKKAVITEVKPRQVYIKRPKMANLSQIVFVVSSKDPKPDLLLLDKQLAFAEYLGVDAVVVLTKIDLDKHQEFKEVQAIYEAIGYPVIQTYARDGVGIESLKKYLKGKRSCFSGNSGVGKSTLINALFAKDMTEEGEISKRNKRGKNTTTATTFYQISEDTYIADTPGFSTFAISEIDSKDLDHYFKEFIPQMSCCEFVGCTHVKEEQCGVKEAVKAKRIDAGRYERFCKIQEELKEKEKRKKW